MADLGYEDLRLAALYDRFDPDRSDLVAYLGIVEEFAARKVVDLGCGTGTFALLLADRGIEVVGVDPADGMLQVAHSKPGADRVQWIRGDARVLAELNADLVTMTGNAAQAVISDEDWDALLAGVHRALRPGGRFVFETRDPAARAWEEWTRETTTGTTSVPGVGRVSSWENVVVAELPLVTFHSTTRFESDGTELVSTTTLRFRSRAEVERSLTDYGFTVEEVRGAPDRPALEFVFLARKRRSTAADNSRMR